jgi:hypothetical protein
LIGTLIGVVAAVAAGGLAYRKLVEHGFVRYNKWDRRVRGSLRAGDPAPDLELTRYDGSSVRLTRRGKCVADAAVAELLKYNA